MSTPPASRGGMTRWMMGERIASGGILLRGRYTGESMRADARGSENDARGEKSRARKRIMNRLFISFSSVKLLRMAHP